MWSREPVGGPFALTDQAGRPRTEADFRGRLLIVYFGYTFCPDVCPVDMQNIGAAMRLLDRTDPALSAKVVPIFITVDPARDTPGVVKQFVAAFHPRIVGLTGSTQAIDRVAKEFAIFHQAGDKQPGGSYLVNHSRQAYLMGPKGEPLALLPQEGPPDAIAAEIRKWVK